MRGSVEAFDGAVDRVFARWRGRRAVDLAAYTASWLGDHGLVWFFLGVVIGRRPGPRRALALRAVVFTGAVTPLVNALVKRSVGRVRPAHDDADSPPVRIPRTASFPSGHTVAAWCAATLFADDATLAPGCYGAALAISASRAHVRLHHASDVVGGAVLGVALGNAAARSLQSAGAS